MFTTEQVRTIAKALRDDAAGLKPATMTDIDLAVAALTSLVAERDRLKDIFVARIIEDKNKEQAAQASAVKAVEAPLFPDAWGLIEGSPHLTPRSANSLTRAGYTHLSQLKGINLRDIPNIGRTCERDIQEAVYAIEMEIIKGAK